MQVAAVKICTQGRIPLCSGRPLNCGQSFIRMSKALFLRSRKSIRISVRCMYGGELMARLLASVSNNKKEERINCDNPILARLVVGENSLGRKQQEGCSDFGATKTKMVSLTSVLQIVP